jgi:hypothetical protein
MKPPVNDDGDARNEAGTHIEFRVNPSPTGAFCDEKLRVFCGIVKKCLTITFL